MSDKLGFLYKGGGDAGSNRLQDGELVDVLLISESFDSYYLDELYKKNESKRAKAESLGQPYEPENPSFKDGGICFDFAIIRRKRLDKSDFEDVFWDEKKGVFTEPNYVAFGRINQYSPFGVYKKKVHGMTFCADNTVEPLKIIQFLPSVYPAAIWENGKILFDASNIPLALEDTENARKCKKWEDERNESWAKEIANWNSKSESEAYAALKQIIARRYLICKKEENELKFLTPKVGTIFRAQINRYKKEKNYLDIRAYQNKGKTLVENYSNFDAEWHEDYESVAKELYEIKVAKTKERQAAAEANEAGSDKPPF